MIELLLVTALTIFLTLFLFKSVNGIKKIEEIEIVASEFDETDLISVIVPMRNEEKNVERCIDSLMNQGYSSYEVIAVDDMSTDNTPSILNDLSNRYPNLRALRGSPMPKGWVGKTHALSQGARIAKGKWILFIDADTYSAPYTLRSALFYARRYKADMLSLFPFQELSTFWERVTQPIIFASIFRAFPNDRVNDPDLEEAFAIGQFILIRRDVYEAVGGHESIRDKIVEDVALAKLVKGSGYLLRVAGGMCLIKTRMYESLHEIWEGWTKNLFLGIEKNWMLLIRSLFILSLLGYLPIFLFLKSGIVFSSTEGLVHLVILLESSWLMFLNVYIAWENTRTYDIPAYYAIFYPLSITIFIGIMLTSAYKVMSGKGVRWKERSYVVKTFI
ncbi:MAG: glycosyltransferase [Candidatus Dadabacteria bacterium]|nr:glycosyltransferase [Candidatus Dadabacteria bacterium]